MAIVNLGRVVGKSAYELWLDAGNTGTIEQYIESLKGDPVELRVTETHIQWRYEDGEWMDLMSIEEMTAAASLAVSAAGLAEEYKVAAQTAKTDALTAKSDAEDAKIAAQNAKSEAADSAAEAEGYATGLSSPNIVITTLDPGMPNTAEWDTTTSPPTLRLGISRGQDGDGSGDMLAAKYDTNNDGIVNRSDVSNALDAAASVSMGQVSGLNTALAGKSNTGHTHAISDVTGLQTALDSKAAPATQTPVTILSSAWTGSAAPYTATLTVSGIATTTKGDIGLADTATAAQREAARNAMISVSGLGAGTISLVADGEKPTIDIPAVLTVLG